MCCASTLHEFQLSFGEPEKTFDLEVHEYFGDIWPPPGRLRIHAVCMLFDRYQPHLAMPRLWQVI